MSRHEQYKNIQFEAGLLNDLERYLAENELVLAEKEVATQESTAKEEAAIESTTKEGAAKKRAAKEDYFKGILADGGLLFDVFEADSEAPEAMFEAPKTPSEAPEAPFETPEAPSEAPEAVFFTPSSAAPSPSSAAPSPSSAAPDFKKRAARRVESNQPFEKPGSQASGEPGNQASGKLSSQTSGKPVWQNIKKGKAKQSAETGNLDRLLERADDTFQESLLKLIDARGRNDADVYKKADIDRRHFSKIRSNPDYRPKKQTALALALALELNLDETIDLIGRAGYAFSPASRSDLIVRYCIEHCIYDLIEVNGLLYRYDQPLLGGQLA